MGPDVAGETRQPGQQGSERSGAVEGRVGIAVGAQQQQPVGFHPGGHMAEQAETVARRPLEVIEDEHHRDVAGGASHRPLDGVEQPQPGVGRGQVGSVAFHRRAERGDGFRPRTVRGLRRPLMACAPQHELASLFGVRRQAVDQWLARGIPSERQEKVQTLVAVCDLLERKLKPGRLAGVARRPADAYGGKTMLELIAANRHRELLELVRDSFDWASAA